MASERVPDKIGVATENQLLKQLDASLLRGASLSTCLSGFGHHFSSNAADSMYEVQSRDYNLSVQVRKLHSFLSHDWKTSRGKKVVAMLIHFNAWAAMLASVISAVLIGLLRDSEPWQDIAAATNQSTRRTDPTSLVPQLVFVLCLCFWQRLRGLVGRPLVVFLDKLCIAQHDPNLKSKGILGLASFLDHSDELIVLWSSRYYTRLWCCFELAAWFRKKPSNARMTVLYAPTSWMLLSWLVGILLGVAAVQLQQWASASGVRPPPRTASLPSAADIPFWLFAWMCCSLPAYLLLGLWTGIQNVDQQLRDFSVRHSDCFCCANNHRHPESGRILMCDRALVFDAVKQWYGEGAAEEHLEKFDREVQTTLRKKVTANLGANKLMPQATLFRLTCGMCSPLLCDSVRWMRDLLWLPGMEPLKVWRCVVALSRFYVIPVTWVAIFLLITLQVTIKMGFPLVSVGTPRLLAALLAGLVQFFGGLFTHWATETLALVMASEGLEDVWPFLAMAFFLCWWLLLKYLQ